MRLCAVFLLGAGIMLGAGTRLSAAAAPATTTRASTPPPKPARTAPAAATALPEPPPSVPDDVNPFADEKTAPQPLKGSSHRERLIVDIHPEPFDGLTVMLLVLKGPDFEWVFDPLSDWVIAPPGPDESLAFVYQPNPLVRLGLTLYPAKDFLPAFTAASVAEYLAMVRGSNVKGFVLQTPIPKNATLLDPTSFAGFQAQGARYATVLGPQITLHHDWFINMKDKYLLLATLSAPPALMDRFNAQIQFFLGRSDLRKGFGVPEPGSAPPPPPANE